MGICLKYQHELPKRIKARGKDAHLTHEELCQCMKWKLMRGKFSPRLKDLIQMNTPRLCMSETRKAFRALTKKDDLGSAIQALCNLKGVGPAMASVILTAGMPEACGFMADECLMAIPEIEGIDYTTKELIKMVEQLKDAANRLNKEGSGSWNPHKVEKALWAHFVLSELKKELLDDMPGNNSTTATNASSTTENGDSQTGANESGKNGAPVPEESNDSVDSTVANKENLSTNTNGTSDGEENSRASALSQEDTNDSVPVNEETNDSLAMNEETNDSVAVNEESNLSVVGSGEESQDNTDEPAQKKFKVDQ
ncbi:protein amun isoform X2 [Oratosquilla oratoria]|uniref:protein amun isoform X2 n=1 Tax=Oratosquilla oratoria TaxID=337810 RepID=UPI003F773BAD